ncbi:MAG: hypothetical protein WCH04_21285 [Gammaproteobacteria bacterium]
MNEIPQVRDYFPEAPREWLDLPAEMTVDVALSDGACVYGGVFTYYARNSVDEALRVLCGPREDGILIAYTLNVRQVVPLLRWDMDWPLSRRGREVPVKRQLAQGAAPWDFETDRSLVNLYQAFSGRGQWNPPYFGQPVVRLRVGGRTREAAIANWYRCARALRRLKNEVIELASDSPAGDDLTVASESEMALRPGRTP